MPDLGRLDAYLDELGSDGYLIDAASDVSDQRYLSGFDAPDPFITLYTPESLSLLVSGLEYGRARTASDADTVRRQAEFDAATLREELGGAEARREVIARFLDDMGVASVAVPERFPVGTADGLRERDVTVTPDTEDVITTIRARKTDDEIGYIERAQRANEAALHAAEDLLAAAAIEDGILRHEGDPLTAERVKEEIEVTLLKRGYAQEDVIVAGGAQSADPHDRGSGPLPAGEPIIVDVFPRDKASKYHSDMTRTFVRGEPSSEVRRRYEVTDAALDAALSAVEPGASGADVHDAACDIYEDAGYATLRSDPTTETGFIHSTGHGVGLDVHEHPRLAAHGGRLEPGHVITVEPGLYDPAVGGVRIEDIVVVTESGSRNLTDYPKELVV